MLFSHINCGFELGSLSPSTLPCNHPGHHQRRRRRRFTFFRSFTLLKCSGFNLVPWTARVVGLGHCLGKLSSDNRSVRVMWPHERPLCSGDVSIGVLVQMYRFLFFFLRLFLSARSTSPRAQTTPIRALVFVLDQSFFQRCDMPTWPSVPPSRPPPLT